MHRIHPPAGWIISSGAASEEGGNATKKTCNKIVPASDTSAISLAQKQACEVTVDC
jgi:hypothetical protein